MLSFFFNVNQAFMIHLLRDQKQEKLLEYVKCKSFICLFFKMIQLKTYNHKTMKAFF